MIDTPSYDTETQVTDFFPESAVVGVDQVPDDPRCSRCKRADAGPVRQYNITYPDGWYKFHCCVRCKDHICTRIERLLFDLGVGSGGEDAIW